MSEENLVRFMNKVTDSEELQAKIGEEIDTEALIALGAECGCEFNEDDFIRLRLERNRVVNDIDLHNADRRRTISRKQIPAWTNHILFTAGRVRIKGPLEKYSKQISIVIIILVSIFISFLIRMYRQ